MEGKTFAFVGELDFSRYIVNGSGGGDEGKTARGVPLMAFFMSQEKFMAIWSLC